MNSFKTNIAQKKGFFYTKISLTYSFILLLVFSCSGVKNTQEAINSGNYLGAINTSLAKLAENKTKKGNQEYILMLESAFEKNTKRELKQISFLKKEGNPANLEAIYNAYLKLHAIQERITPILPLRIYQEGRNAKFSFKEYNDDILSSKKELSVYLYDNAIDLVLSAKNKEDYRRAYADLKYLTRINPNYKDTRQKIEDVYQKGLDYVQVELFNSTLYAIPQNLEEDLLNFNTYDLNDLWTRYHTNPQKDIQYSYSMQLDFNSILISPEQVNTNVSEKEKRIKDGWKYVLDANGNVAKDSLGNDRKVDKFKIVKCTYYKYTQYKDIQISGKVSYFDLSTKQQINSYPLSSGFVFEHVYAQYQGDKRAIDDDYLLKLANRGALLFPSNEQMIYDSAEDLKRGIKNIIKNYRLNKAAF